MLPRVLLTDRRYVQGLCWEITLAEQDVARIRPGRVVALRARAAPFETMEAEVSRVAPVGDRGQEESTVTVYARFDEASAGRKPGMTGYARFTRDRVRS